MRTRRCRTILVIGISLLLAGCEPADLSGNGVIGVFGADMCTGTEFQGAGGRSRAIPQEALTCAQQHRDALTFVSHILRGQRVRPLFALACRRPLINYWRPLAAMPAVVGYGLGRAGVATMFNTMS